ncbi:MAG TPA: ATP-binding protein, partial [Deltaproteobacteria bacterium]|nr:ATP-binding protein [Deltaproteobacteria bacterium]
MIVKVISSAILGIESYAIDVEVDITRGLPQFSTVGLPDTAVRESKDRIKAAIKNSGYSFPKNRVTVNLSPADIKKEGTSFDLPIAISILTAEGLVEKENIGRYMIIGELSLDGSIKGVQGILSASLLTKRQGLRGIIVPRENASEAAMVDSIDVIPVDYLHHVVEFLNGIKHIQPLEIDDRHFFTQALSTTDDFADVSGQDQAKRALEIAAAGGHNIL